MHPNELSDLSDQRGLNGAKLHRTILNEHVENFILTALDYLDCEKVDVSNPEFITESLRSSGQYLLDAMALSFFTRNPVSVGDIFTKG